MVQPGRVWFVANRGRGTGQADDGPVEVIDSSTLIAELKHHETEPTRSKAATIRRMHRSPSGPLPADLRTRMLDLRTGLLGLHKALIIAEQLTYERIYGRVESTGQLLHLVMNDPWFAWLHPFSNLVVRIDEMLEMENEASIAEAHALLQEAPQPPPSFGGRRSIPAQLL